LRDLHVLPCGPDLTDERLVAECSFVCRKEAAEAKQLSLAGARVDIDDILQIAAVRDAQKISE